jgi:hypothetical protein
MISILAAGFVGMLFSTDAFAPTRISLFSKVRSSSYSASTSLFEKFAVTEPVEDVGLFFTSFVDTDDGRPSQSGILQSRILGSQELLMLPRQWSPGDATFPSMNHISCTLLSVTPSLPVLRQALEYVLQSHPLLHAYVQGDGEPEKRIDLLHMVRKGDPNPLTFVSEPGRFSADEVLTIVNLPDSLTLDASWKSAFCRDLDDGSWCSTQKGPLWKVELHRTPSESAPCALVFSFNHAISDQSSANRLTDQIVRCMADIERDQALSPPILQKMPIALEDSVLGVSQRWNDVQTKGISWGTIGYIAGKAAEGLKNPLILPDQAAIGSSNNNPLGALTIISGNTAGGQDKGSQQRKSTVQFRTLSRPATAALLARCRAKNVTFSNALTAAVTLMATDFVGPVKSSQRRNYKVLQSLDMRRFGAMLDQGDTVACMAGSHDLMHGPLMDGSGSALRRNPVKNDVFWNLAREGKRQTEAFVASDGPQHATRVFDFAMSISDLNNLVYLTAQSKDTKGRAYSAGVTNVGVYEQQKAFRSTEDSEGDRLMIQHGRFKIQDIFFATPHKQSGCLYPVSGMTVDGELKLSFHPVTPIVSQETNERFADSFIELLEIMAGTKGALSEASDSQAGVFSDIPENTLTYLAALGGFVAVLSQAGNCASFFESVMQMKANVADPTDFWAALNFWIFFAVGHPILQPILAISDVLHASPGPQIGGLVPATFVAGNAIAIGAFLKSKQVRSY